MKVLQLIGKIFILYNMTEEDKKAEVEDCKFIVLAKFPSGHIHLVNVKNSDITLFLSKQEKFEVFEDNIKEVDFTPIL